ncbi:MAG: NAD(P)-dependent oxidoreductase [Planctomycetota bacterium]|nr:NAD(P)-dependent oxidoreductase [Planctomycetota bacterium]MDA1211982.1 NAD(P)-dependent oxidoreductase [Planctomycetota bacterium]
MIVVTGAAGRLGRAVVQRLLSQGYDVVGTDIVPFATSPVRFEQADLCDRSAVDQLLRGAEAVIHLGAIPGPRKPAANSTASPSVTFSDDPFVIFENNVASTLNVLMLAGEHKLRRVVFSSSAFAMGWAHDPRAFEPLYLPLDEDHPPMPFEPYGLSKLVGECIAGMVARTSTTSVVSLRFSNVVPVDRQGELPWPAPTPENPLTLVMWSYADPRDVAEAHVKALEADITGHEAFLIAQPVTRFRESTRELIRLNFGNRIEIRGELIGNASIINSSKAERMLAWKAKYRWDNR